MRLNTRNIISVYELIQYWRPFTVIVPSLRCEQKL